MSVITGDRHLLPPTFHAVETSVSIAPETPTPETCQTSAYPDYQNALHELAQAIEWSHGSFSLILAHCNSLQVRHHVLQDLTQICALSLQSIALEPSAELMFSSILQNLENPQNSQNLQDLENPQNPQNLQMLRRSTATLPINLTCPNPSHHQTSPASKVDEFAGHLADHSVDFVDSPLAVTIAASQPPIAPHLPDLQKNLAHANAITISGFETVLNIETLLASADIIRDELRKVFHCPIVWWVNDEILVKLMRIAPNIHSWFTSVEFPGAELARTEFTELPELPELTEIPELIHTNRDNPDLKNTELAHVNSANTNLANPDLKTTELVHTELANSESFVQVEMMCEVA